MSQSLFPDGVKFNTPTTGTGALTAAAAVNGFRGSEGLSDGKTYSYWISDAGGMYESGQGIFTQSTLQLTRIPLYSSNGGSAINLSGSATVAIVARGEDIASRDLSNLAPTTFLDLPPLSQVPSTPSAGHVRFYVDATGGSHNGWCCVMNSQGAVVEIIQAP